MDERAGALPLWWVLGTFHAVASIVSLIWLVYPGGGLGDLLSSLSTISGLGLFLGLWAISSFTTRRALRGHDWLSDDPDVMRGFFWRALRWGAATGVMFLATLVTVLLVSAAMNAAGGGQVQIASVLLVALIYGSIGTIFAAVIGGLIGVTLGALDIAALRIARALTGS